MEAPFSFEALRVSNRQKRETKYGLLQSAKEHRYSVIFLDADRLLAIVLQVFEL